MEQHQTRHTFHGVSGFFDCYTADANGSENRKLRRNANETDRWGRGNKLTRALGPGPTSAMTKMPNLPAVDVSSFKPARGFVGGHRSGERTLLSFAWRALVCITL